MHLLFPQSLLEYTLSSIMHDILQKKMQIRIKHGYVVHLLGVPTSGEECQLTFSGSKHKPCLKTFYPRISGGDKNMELGGGVGDLTSQAQLHKYTMPFLLVTEGDDSDPSLRDSNQGLLCF